jgi:toxin ParE1/3/4
MSAGKLRVVFSEDASRDLDDICTYIAAHDSELAASDVLEALLAAAAKLAHFPERGSHPQELSAQGIRTYRQTMFKPYRIVYRIRASTVEVLLIADGRRNMLDVLSKRLLKG